MIKIAIINSHPIQYFAPLYKELNKSNEIDITALYLSDLNLKPSIDPGFKQKIQWDVNMLDGYKYKFIGKYQTNRPNGFWSLIVPQIWNEIRQSEYDVIWLHGYNFAAYIVAFFAAKSKGIKVFFRGESHLMLKRSFLKKTFHVVFCKIFFQYIDAFLAIGTSRNFGCFSIEPTMTIAKTTKAKTGMVIMNQSNSELIKLIMNMMFRKSRKG